MNIKNILSSKISHAKCVKILSSLGRMLQSGLSVHNALVMLLDIYNTRSAEFRLVRHLIDNIQGGKSFADSLIAVNFGLTNWHLSLIRIGESSNSMPTILAQIVDNFLYNTAIKKRIKKALIYPACIVFVCICVLWVLLQFALPQISQMFLGANMELPYITALIVEIASVLNQNTINIVLVLVAIVLGTYICIHYLVKPTRLWVCWHRAVLSVPLIGKLYTYNFLINYTSSLAITLGSGMQLLQSLSLSSTNYKHPVFKEFTADVASKVGYGKCLYDAIASYPFIPVYFKQMIKVAEVSNDLPAVLSKIAAQYGEDLDYIISSSLSWFEYILVMVMGILVSVFVVAIYLPIFSLGTTFHV